MFSAFYPTSDWWFWVVEEPPRNDFASSDPEARAAFLNKVVWRGQQPYGEIGVCADGLIFADFGPEDQDDLAAVLYRLNALNLLFVSTLRSQLHVDAGLEWLSRTDRIRDYEPDSGFGGSANFYSRNSGGLHDRYWPENLHSERLKLRKHIDRDILDVWLARADDVFPSTTKVRLLAEYALAISLFHDHNFAGALTHSWFVSEHLFSAKWQALFPNRNIRTQAGQKINDLQAHIDPSLHSDLETIRVVRNDLAHAIGNSQVVTDEHVNLAFEVADGMIAMEWGLNLGLGGRGFTF